MTSGDWSGMIPSSFSEIVDDPVFLAKVLVTP
jgi:hypothetical protein